MQHFALGVPLVSLVGPVKAKSIASFLSEWSDMNPETDPVTGQVVVDEFKAVVESFFNASSHFRLQIEVGGFLPLCRGVGQRARIVLPDHFSTLPVAKFEDLAFLLLVLGHETAHYLHKHNEHEDRSSLDTRAIEMWADFYGTKLAMVALTISAEFKKLSDALPGGQGTGERIDGLASALATLANSYFNTQSDKYESAPVRVATCVAGMLSFFEVLFPLQAGAAEGTKGYDRESQPDVVVQRAISLQKRIYSNTDLYRLVLAAGPLNLTSEQVQVISEIHKGIQAGQAAMFSSMEPIPAEWLRLNYDISEEERQKIVEKKQQTLSEVLQRLGLEATPQDQKNENPDC